MKAAKLYFNYVFDLFEIAYESEINLRSYTGDLWYVEHQTYKDICKLIEDQGLTNEYNSWKRSILESEYFED